MKTTTLPSRSQFAVLRLHSGLLVTCATAPSRNDLSHSNKECDASLAEKIFWTALGHLQTLHPGFAHGNRGEGVARRFRRVIHVVDSSTIQLVVSCMDWAKHRRRKAAAKCHLRVELHSFLPRFAIIDTARENDGKRSRELCAGIRSGEIVVFDKAYIDFATSSTFSNAHFKVVTLAPVELRAGVLAPLGTYGFAAALM